MLLSGIILIEGYGDLISFKYPNYNVDPTPRVLSLGRWSNPRTRKTVVGGINLNYLNKNQFEKLQKAMPAIMRMPDLRSRYRLGAKLLPDIFDRWYRTYDAATIQQPHKDGLPYGADAARKKPQTKTDKLRKLIKQKRDERRRKQKERDIKDKRKEIQVGRISKTDPQLDQELPLEPEELREPDEEEVEAKETAASLLNQPEEQEEPFEPEPHLTIPDPIERDVNLDDLDSIEDVAAAMESAPALAVVDAISGRTVISRRPLPVVLAENRWDYGHTIRLQTTGGRILMSHDGLPQHVVDRAVPQRVLQALRKVACRDRRRCP